MTENLSIPCPICKKRVLFGTAEFPFCSERCKQIDLGMWANEEYRIAKPLNDFEIVEMPRPDERREGDKGKQ